MKEKRYWCRMSIEQLFVFCQLDKQMRYEAVWKSFDALDTADLTSFEGLAQASVRRIESNLRGSGYRFASTAARHLSRNAISIDPQMLHTITREKLEEVAIGFGPKLASLFVSIRDQNEDIAILDIHIRRFIREEGYEITGDYAVDEKTFGLIAKKRGMSVRELDLEVWEARRKR